jgi:hypothetical protein
MCGWNFGWFEADMQAIGSELFSMLDATARGTATAETMRHPGVGNRLAGMAVWHSLSQLVHSNTPLVMAYVPCPPIAALERAVAESQTTSCVSCALKQGREEA